MLNFFLNLFCSVDLPDYIQSNGFQFVPPRALDWVLGKETGIVFDNRNPSGNWLQDLQIYEPQKLKFETSACVTFGGHHVLTTQLNWLYRTKNLSKEAIRFFEDNGYVENGKFNLNEIFNIAQNGTTKEGNYMQNYWDNVRKVGIVPQKAWTQLQDCNVWEDMQKPIPQTVKNLGLECLKYININYEWVLTSKKNDTLIRQSLLQSPLQIATPVCPTWGSGEVKSCGITSLAHVTMLYGVEPDGQYNIFDQYSPFLKHLSADYYIPCAIKAVITDKGYVPPPKPPVERHIFAQVMSYGETSDEILALQNLLKKLGYFTLEPTGYFGPRTAEALYRFQVENNVASKQELDNLQGRRAGVKTLAKLNEIQK